jgi:tetratricopeptide (TPR) repeat protein
VPATDTIVIDCQAYGLYPYVGCNELMRVLFPDIRRDRPDLVREFARSLVTLAPDTHAGVLDAFPDLVDVMGEAGGIPFAAGLRDEGLHPLDRPTWLAHGVVSLILRWRSGLAGAPILRLVFTNCAAADPLQTEFLDILARRADPGLLQVIRHDHADGLSAEEPGDRLAELMARNRRGLDLSIVLHRLERGTTSADVALRAFTDAAKHYLAVGFYEAALHCAHVAARYAPPDDSDTARTLCSVTVGALLLLGRLEEAEAVCAAQLAASDDPVTRMICSYARAVTYARFNPADQRDFRAAAQHLEFAIEYLDRGSQGPSEVGNRIFLDKNFRALLAIRARRTDEAMRLLDEGLADIRRLCPERTQAESPIFFQNKARVYMALKQFDLAVAAYTQAIELEPFTAELHFERGNARRAGGDQRAALADYRLAMQAGPPRPEMHFNAGLTCAALGEHDQALDEYTLALDLDPQYVSARLNRATAHYQAGRLTEAGQDAEIGLRDNPGHPDLLCVRGLVTYASGALEAALADFSAALVHNPSHAAALKNRTSVWLAKGNAGEALRDADRCIAIRPDGAAFLNRGYLHQSNGSWQRAIADYQQAAQYGDVDRAELARRHATCIRGLMDEAVKPSRADTLRRRPANGSTLPLAR